MTHCQPHASPALHGSTTIVTLRRRILLRSSKSFLYQCLLHRSGLTRSRIQRPPFSFEMKANMEGYCEDDIKMHLAVVPSSRHIEPIEKGLLKICQLPSGLSYDNYWPMQKIPLKGTPQQVTYFADKNLYPLIVSFPLAHRVVGYLEEEAIHSYTKYLKDIDSGAIENVRAPATAIDYWRLPKNATLKDVITVIRADEAHHRDVNHFASIVLHLDICLLSPDQLWQYSVINLPYNSVIGVELMKYMFSPCWMCTFRQATERSTSSCWLSLEQYISLHIATYMLPILFHNLLA